MLSKYFKRSEFACKCGCGKDTMDAELLQVLEDIRDFFGGLTTIHSGNRCEKYNKSVDGKPNSQHLVSKAADISVAGYAPHEVFIYLSHLYPDKYGMGLYSAFVHIDVRKQKARW